MKKLIFIIVVAFSISTQAQTIPVLPSRPKVVQPAVTKPKTVYIEKQLDKAIIKFVCDVDAELYVDGKLMGKLEKDLPLRLKLAQGEYIFKAVSKSNKNDFIKWNYVVDKTNNELLETINLAEVVKTNANTTNGFLTETKNQSLNPEKKIEQKVTVKSVIDAYVLAIGGDKAVRAVKSIAYTGSTTIPQAPMPLSYSSKMDSKGRMAVDLSMVGMGSIMKQVVNGNTGYAMQQGQKKVLEGEELAKMKENAILFSETLLATKNGVTISGIKPINGSDAYAVVDGDTTYYFDVESSLKTAEDYTNQIDGEKFTWITYFKDYKVVKGVKVPFNTIMNEGFELDIKMSDVKINEGVSDKDFE